MRPDAPLNMWVALRVRLRRVRVDGHRGRGLAGFIRCWASIVRRWRWHEAQIERDWAARRVFGDPCRCVDRGTGNHGCPFG